MWVPLEQLRALPLPAEGLIQLLESLRRSGTGVAAPARPVELLVEITNLTAARLRSALEQRALAEGLEALEALRRRVEELARQQPQQQEVRWSRFGDLLAQVTARVHGAVFENDGGEPLEDEPRAELCWQAARVLEATRTPEVPVPEWQPVLEQQLVQEGALAWREREGAAAAERSLDLFLRLAELLDPVPEWVVLQCRDLLQPPLEELLLAPRIEPGALEPWIARLARFPVAAERQEALAAALLRARMSLELLHYGQSRAESPTEPAVPLRLGLSNPDPAGEAGAAESFALEPFLDGDGEGATLALEAFLQSRAGAERAALHPVSSLLEDLHQRPRRLDSAALAVLSQAAGLWQERLGPGLVPLPEASSTGLLVELEPTELVLLQQLIEQREAVEPALVELRRRHHDEAFWRDPAPRGPAAEWTVLQALREFHRSGGFFASSHAPMESLLRWAQPALAALGEAQVWSASAAVAALWLPVALRQPPAEGSSGGTLVAPPGREELLRSLGGREVVLVGTSCEALRSAHREGQLFCGEAFGLRCLELPASRHPRRPAAGFEDSLADSLASIEALQRERPFSVLLLEGSAYRLPLALAVRQRFGVRSVCGSGGLGDWLLAAAEQPQHSP